jgi:hypothetical protein
MKVTITASTGAEIVIWREKDTFYARRADTADAPEICLAVDLFEVIAELTGLDLEQRVQASEALYLSERAQLRVASEAGESAGTGEELGAGRLGTEADG